jgi:hypothetical protein
VAAKNGNLEGVAGAEFAGVAQTIRRCEAEAAVIGRVAEDDDPGRVEFAAGGDAGLDEGGADALPLEFRDNGQRGQAQAGGIAIVGGLSAPVTRTLGIYGGRTEEDVAHGLTIQDGFERNCGFAASNEQVDQAGFDVGGEGGLVDRFYVGKVGRCGGFDLKASH